MRRTRWNCGSGAHPASGPGRAWAAAVEAARRFLDHDGPLAAAAIAYYGIFSMFPMLLVVLALLAFLFPSIPARWPLLRLAETYLAGTEELVRDNVARLIRFRSELGAMGLAFLLWSASAVFTALSRGLDRAVGCLHAPSPLRARIVGVVMVLLTALLLVVALAGTTLLAAAARRDPTLRWQPFTGLHPIAAQDLSLIAHVLGLVLTFGAVLLVYRLVPSQAPPGAKLWPGALLATAGLHTARAAFAMYAAGLSPHALLYGSIGVVIMTLLWFYVSAVIVIFGLEFSVALRDVSNR